MPLPEPLHTAYVANHKSDYTMYAADKAGNMELRIADRQKVTKVQFRNVGNRNPDASIQIGIEEYNKDTNRTKVLSFSVPLSMVETFLAHISKPHQ